MTQMVEPSTRYRMLKGYRSSTKPRAPFRKIAHRSGASLMSAKPRPTSTRKPSAARTLRSRYQASARNKSRAASGSTLRTLAGTPRPQDLCLHGLPRQRLLLASLEVVQPTVELGIPGCFDISRGFSLKTEDEAARDGSPCVGWEAKSFRQQLLRLGTHAGESLARERASPGGQLQPEEAARVPAAGVDHANVSKEDSNRRFICRRVRPARREGLSTTAPYDPGTSFRAASASSRAQVRICPSSGPSSMIRSLGSVPLQRTSTRPSRPRADFTASAALDRW